MSEAPEFLTGEQARFLADDHLQRLFSLIEEAGGEIRVNGGAVRNALMDEPVHEVDLSTTLTPDMVTQCLENGGIKVAATGVEHGTVTAVAGGRGYEITTLREDIETHGRHAVVRFGTDWQADALRRDFTMNALYCDRRGRLFDPLGGYGDVLARQVRFIGRAEDRIAEDYLRILRFFRFYAWYGSGRPDADGLKACVKLRDNLSVLSVERVWQELKRLLSAPDPVRAVLWMRTAKVLAAALPENGNWGADMLAQLVAAEHDIGLDPDPLLRLMALLPPRSELVTAMAARLKLAKREQKRLEDWAAQALPPAKMSQKGFAQRLYRGSPQALSDALMLELARERTYRGETGQAKELVRRIRFVRQWQRPVFPLAGRDLIKAGMTAGPKMGRLLSRLEGWWVERNFTPGKAEIIAEAQRIVSDARD